MADQAYKTENGDTVIVVPQEGGSGSTVYRASKPGLSIDWLGLAKCTLILAAIVAAAVIGFNVLGPGAQGVIEALNDNRLTSGLMQSIAGMAETVTGFFANTVWPPVKGVIDSIMGSIGGVAADTATTVGAAIPKGSPAAAADMAEGVGTAGKWIAGGGLAAAATTIGAKLGLLDFHIFNHTAPTLTGLEMDGHTLSGAVLASKGNSVMANLTHTDHTTASVNKASQYVIDDGSEYYQKDLETRRRGGHAQREIARRGQSPQQAGTQFAERIASERPALGPGRE